jgi:hypothetical protein
VKKGHAEFSGLTLCLQADEDDARLSATLGGRIDMAKLDEIVKHPNYTAAASSASKATIFVFIATFAYLAFFSGTSPGLIGGAAFFFGGISVVSLIISMPLFLLRAKVPRFGLLISLADIALTIFLTRAIYLWLFTQVSVAGSPFVVVCREPIPEFTLGLHSNPSEAEVHRLCACVWEKLQGWEKDTARALAEKRSGDVSALNMRAFPSRFGSRLKECGGMDL